ncbi:MAG: tetratricopeptide repeat protein [Nitrospiraceae bacterium]
MNRYGRYSVLRGLMVCGLAATCVACGATDEQLRKSSGYYQEGLANLSSDRQRAFVSFQKAVQMNPKNRDAHYGLGHIYAQQGKYEEAEASFRKVLSIDPEHSESHTYLGQVLTHRARWAEAVEEYKAALANPLYATPDLARFHMGRALVQTGDLKGALSAYEDAATVKPPNVPPALLNLELGRTYLALGMDQKAKETLGKVVSMDQGGEYGVAADHLLKQAK